MTTLKKAVSYDPTVSAGSRLPAPVASEIGLYIAAAFTAFVSGAPGGLDSWSEIVAAIQADQTSLSSLTTLVGQKVPYSLVDAKGDLLVGTADNTVARLAVGPNTQFFVADSAQTAGVKWTDTLENAKFKNYTEVKYAGGNTGTAKTIDLNNGTVQTFTLTGNCVFTMPAQPGAGESKSFSVLLKTGAGAFTGAFTGVKWPGDTAPAVTATAARMDLFTFIADGTSWFGAAQQNYTP